MSESLHDVVIVAAAGNSVKDMDLKEIRKRGYLIGVKNCAWLLNADIGLSLDRKWATEYGDKLQGKPWLLYRYPGQWSWEGLEQFSSNKIELFSEKKNSGLVNTLGILKLKKRVLIFRLIGYRILKKRKNYATRQALRL